MICSFIGSRRRRHRTRTSRPVGIMLAIGLLAPFQALPAQDRQSEDLAALSVIAKRFEQISPRPARISATQESGNGYWEKLDLNVAKYGVMRRFLPTERSVHPALIAYWIDRTERDDREWDMVSDSGQPKWPARWQFASRSAEVVSSVAALNPWSGPLKVASEALAEEAKKALHATYGVDSAEERKAMLRALDLKGKRQAVEAALGKFLAAAGDLDPERNAGWKPVYQFLLKDAEEQWNGFRKDRDEKKRVDSSLSMTYWGADRSAFKVTTAQVEKLIAIKWRLSSMEVKLLEDALAPGRMPMAFLEGAAREFIDTRIEFDRELVRALDLPEVKTNPVLVSGLIGLFDVWKTLQRREEFLKAGRWALSIGVLKEVALTVLKAESWTKTDFDPDTGERTDSVVVQRAGQTVDQLDKCKERWLNRRSPKGSLHAAVEVDEKGNRVWTPYNWTVWKWMTADELDDLTTDGRVVKGLGRRWLVAAGSRFESIRSMQDLRAADAREIFVGLTAAGARKGLRRDLK